MPSLVETVSNLTKLKDLISRITKLKITSEEYAYLKALVLFSVGKLFCFDLKWPKKSIKLIAK